MKQQPEKSSVGEAITCLGIFSFSKFWGFFYILLPACAILQSAMMQPGLHFSVGVFYLSESGCRVYPLAAVLLSKCHQVRLALIKLTLPKAGFWLGW